MTRIDANTLVGGFIRVNSRQFAVKSSSFDSEAYSSSLILKRALANGRRIEQTAGPGLLREFLDRNPAQTDPVCAVTRKKLPQILVALPVPGRSNVRPV